MNIDSVFKSFKTSILVNLDGTKFEGSFLTFFELVGTSNLMEAKLQPKKIKLFSSEIKLEATLLVY